MIHCSIKEAFVLDVCTVGRGLPNRISILGDISGPFPNVSPNLIETPHPDATQYAILSKSIMRTARNYFIVSLAVSDLVLCSVTMPLTLWDILR